MYVSLQGQPPDLGRAHKVSFPHQETTTAGKELPGLYVKYDSLTHKEITWETLKNTTLKWIHFSDD